MKRQHLFPKLIFAFALLMAVLLLGALPAQAKVEAFVAEADGELYEYEYKTLLESYAMFLLGAPAPLYNDYIKKRVVYLYDDVNSYVDYQNALEAYAIAVLTGKNFDLDTYTAGPHAKLVSVDMVQVVTVEGGKLKFTAKVIRDPAALALAQINAAPDVQALRIALETLAGDLNLDLSQYNPLSEYAKNLVASGLLDKRGGGFSDPAVFREALKTEVQLILDNLVGVILHELNSAPDALTLRKVLETNSTELVLNLTEYNKLPSNAKTLVAQGVLTRKGTGYTETLTLAQVFGEEVQKTKDYLTNALAQINGADDLASLSQLLTEHGSAFDLEMDSFTLVISTRTNRILNQVLEARPYASGSSLKQTFNEAVASTLTSYVVVFYTDYNRTLAQIVDIQMSLSAKPQWWVSGQGWRNAPREEVEKYVDPRNFVAEDLINSVTEAIVAVNTLTLRDAPTTQGAALAQVHRGQIFLVENIQLALEGTQAGTEGWWFQITIGEFTGWIFSRHTHWVAESYIPAMFQFLNLSGPSGASQNDLAIILAGKGILSGMEQAFYQASKENNINEIFLTSLALHETGNGRSVLANGQLFEGKMVYNMFGIGAYDSNPNYWGAKYAYEQGWFTPELAIIGGAKFASRNYVNHPTYLQDTLYKMRWNPATPGVHQYATDVAWASKQTSFIRQLYNQINLYNLRFDIPRYK